FVAGLDIDLLVRRKIVADVGCKTGNVIVVRVPWDVEPGTHTGLVCEGDHHLNRHAVVPDIIAVARLVAGCPRNRWRWKSALQARIRLDRLRPLDETQDLEAVQCIQKLWSKGIGRRRGG